MRRIRRPLGIAFLLSVQVCIAGAQTEKPPSAATTPPKILLLVHQQFKFGSESARQKLEASVVRTCTRLDVPNSWIDLQAMTGAPEALSFDPFDSFEQVENASVFWPQLYASHPALAQIQEQIRALETSESTVIAVRRDDLGYRANRIDLSKMRFMRILEVRLRPGHEREFVEAFQLLSGAYEKINSDMPWVVYQVNLGMPSPSFLVFVPMHALRENDGMMASAPRIHEAEGDAAVGRMQEIARDAYAFSQSNLYAVSPETSHVSKEIIDGDPDFWLSKPSASVRPSPPLGTVAQSLQTGAAAN